MSKNKIIFAIIGLVSVVLLLIGISALGSKPTVVKDTGPKDFSVWVVGDETAGYSDIITGFKERFPQYNKKNIKFTKFASYEDYEKTLLTVMADGNGPDILTINNNGGELLEGKISAIPGTKINIEEFQKRYNKAFDDLIIRNKEKNEEGDDVVKSYLKGVPLGYETLGIFYNWKLVKNVPLTWADLDEEISSSSGGTDYSTVALGLSGKYIFNAADVFSVFLLQKGTNTYKNMKLNNSLLALKAYESYSNDPNNNLMPFKKEMDSLGFTTVDLFVRGKIGMIIGYPSLLKEIELAIKRASGNTELNERFLRSSELPQISLKGKDDKVNLINIINYNYLAISKLTQNEEMAYSFLNYLTRQETQEKYLKSFTYYLPSLKALEGGRLEEEMSKTFDRVKYSSFLVDRVSLSSFDKGLKTDFDNYFNKNLGENISEDSGSENDPETPKTRDNSDMLGNGIKNIDCNKSHLIDLSGFDQECK
ncbi:MAG: ABC transporter substrate-binding protein [Candidatus Gracilibacteria bacterium]|nr:ABC transporter substrate-binding protein [Candidatus Gracilibacteria bacterium]